MLLQQLFDNLAHGEFSNLAVGNSSTGSIKEAAYPKVVSHVNRALREIYKRFILKKKYIYVHQQEGVSTYYLRSDYLGSVGSMNPTAYLEEVTAEPFTDDLIEVLAVWNSEEEEVPLNVPRYANTGIFSTAFDTLEIPLSDTQGVFKIQYQAEHPRIVITEDFDPETYQLQFPGFIEDALTLHIASQLFKGKTSKASEGEGYATNTYHYRFDQACKRLEDLGLAEVVTVSDQRFRRKGFV